MESKGLAGTGQEYLWIAVQGLYLLSGNHPVHSKQFCCSWARSPATPLGTFRAQVDKAALLAAPSIHPNIDRKVLRVCGAQDGLAPPSAVPAPMCL